jgi:hypothetical protein
MLRGFANNSTPDAKFELARFANELAHVLDRTAPV